MTATKCKSDHIQLFGNIKMYKNSNIYVYMFCENSYMSTLYLKQWFMSLSVHSCRYQQGWIL